jgi:hypothetical protein
MSGPASRSRTCPGPRSPDRRPRTLDRVLSVQMLVMPAFLAGVSRVTGLAHAAECNKAPFMYEMKGALSGYGPGSASFPASRLRVSQSPGLTVPDQLVSQPHRSRSTGRPASLFRFVRLPGLPGATRRPLVPDTRGKYRFPGFPAPRGSPGMVPVSCGESISTPSATVTQELAGIHFKYFSCPHVVHRIPPVIRMPRRLSTGFCTTHPQVTWRNSDNTCAWSPYVLPGTLPCP